MKEEGFTSRFVVKLVVHSTESIKVSPDLLAQLFTGFDSNKLLYYRGDIDSAVITTESSLERVARVIPATNKDPFAYKSFLVYRVDPYHWNKDDELDKQIKQLVYSERKIKLRDLQYTDINISDTDVIENIIEYCKANNLLLIANYLACCQFLMNKLNGMINNYNQNHNYKQQTNLQAIVVYNYNFNEINYG